MRRSPISRHAPPLPVLERDSRAMDPRRRSVISALPFVAWLLAAPSLALAQAQATTGVIRGTVKDSTGRPLADASVSLRHLATNAQRTLTTNASGVYIATLLRVGTYDVAARAVGFQESRRDSAQVRLGETVEINFALAPQVVQLQELTEAAPQRGVDPTQSESATRLGVEA